MLLFRPASFRRKEGRDGGEPPFPPPPPPLPSFLIYLKSRVAAKQTRRPPPKPPGEKGGGGGRGDYDGMRDKKEQIFRNREMRENKSVTWFFLFPPLAINSSNSKRQRVLPQSPPPLPPLLLFQSLKPWKRRESPSTYRLPIIKLVPPFPPRSYPQVLLCSREYRIPVQLGSKKGEGTDYTERERKRRGPILLWSFLLSSSLPSLHFLLCPSTYYERGIQQYFKRKCGKTHTCIKPLRNIICLNVVVSLIWVSPLPFSPD